MTNPYYNFTQTSFPGRIARASELNTQFKAIEAGFDSVIAVGGADTQVQFNDGGNLGGEAAFSYNKTTDTLSVPNLTVSTALTGAAGTFSGALQSAGFTATGVADLQSNVTVGGTLAVTGKATAAATVGGDGATTVVTKGYAESAFAPISHNHAASEITSGTFTDARVAASNVTQHVGSIDHDSLLNYNIAQHRVINDASTAATVLWSAEKVNNELQTIVAGENPPAGSDGMVQYNNAGLYGGQAEFSWNDTTFTLTVGSVTNAGTLNVVGGKVTSAATVGGDGSTTLITKGYAESTFADASHTHAASDVTSGEFAEARIPGLPTSKIDSGTFGVVRGGTGLNSLVASNYIRASTNSSFELRTPAQVLADIGAAASVHTHAAGDITSGTFSVNRLPVTSVSKGGTGLTWLTSGYFLSGNGTAAMSARTPAQVRVDIGANNASNLTTGTISTSRLPTTSVTKGGTGRTSVASGNYLIGNGFSAMTVKTPSEVLADIGAASSSHTHSAAEITSGVLSSARIPSLDASKITTGTFSTSRLPTIPVPLGGTGLTTAPTNEQFLVGNGALGYDKKTATEVKAILDVVASHVAGGGQITVSTGAPTGGANGDIHLKV